MDQIRALEDMGPWQTLAFIFLLLVIAVTFVQVVRVAWWAFRAAPSRARDAAGAARLSSGATRVAHSTRGLARAAVWLTCAGGAAGLNSAKILYGNSGAPPLSILIRQHLGVLEAGAISLGLCALLFAASLVFDLVAARTGRHSLFPPVGSAPDVDGAGDTGRLALLRRGRVALGLIALVLVSLLLLDLGPTAAAVTGRDPFFSFALDAALEQLWSRLAIILATVGVLTWLMTLLESAMLRRRLRE